MTFPVEYHTLTPDVPTRGSTPAPPDDLNEIVRRRGVRLYLARDAQRSLWSIHQGYPRFDAFAAVCAEANDETYKFACWISRRFVL